MSLVAAGFMLNFYHLWTKDQRKDRHPEMNKNAMNGSNCFCNSCVGSRMKDHDQLQHHEPQARASQHALGCIRISFICDQSVTSIGKGAAAESRIRASCNDCTRAGSVDWLQQLDIEDEGMSSRADARSLQVLLLRASGANHCTCFRVEQRLATIRPPQLRLAQVIWMDEQALSALWRPSRA